ncbi:MAG: PCI domain-containing protein [Candidatus Lokiarchaeota archaeon]|nr:PCI domain-containing protein [Candidatus Harpocratesius repetitus]
MELNRVQAGDRKNRCQILEKSKCPQCGSFLEFKTLPSGQMYLQCTKCSWNSRTNSPIILGTSERYIEREAEKYGLSTRADKCNERLRHRTGFEFCLNCFEQDLQNSTETPFHLLQMRYGLNHQEIERIITERLSSGNVRGLLDKKKKVFINLSDQMEAQLVMQLQSQGFLDLQQIQTDLSCSRDTVIKIIIEMIRKHKLRGTFTHTKNRYYIEQGLIELILQELNNQGKIVHYEFARRVEIPEGNVKNYIMNMMRNKIITAFFADGGKETISETELENEIENYCIKNGLFLITSLAGHLKIAPELARKSLFKLIQKGVVRGIFTQNHEFLTEEKLSEKIKAIARAYRKISIRDLALKLAITEQRVEEGLATLISKGSINGYIDMTQRLFVADGKQPVTAFSSHVSDNKSQGVSSPGAAQPIGEVEVVRQYDFVGGQLHFKVVVRNKTNMAIHDIKVILDVPSSYRRAQELITINVIDPGNTHGVDFYLEPAECGISTIGGTVIYKDAMGKFHTIFIKPKDVQIKCPLLIRSLDTIEDCQKAIQSLPSDARAFLIADLPAAMAYSAAHRAVAQFDVTNVASYENDEGGVFEAEAWFSSEAKVTGGRVIIRVYMNGKTNTLELRVWCNEAGQLTGLLAKMIELLFVEVNLMRKIKSEERSKTLDVMAITRNLMEVSNICLLRYKASSARLKLEDTYSRLTRISDEYSNNCQKIYDWIKRLEEDPYNDEEAMLTDEDADALDADIQIIHNQLEASLNI